jgi:D-alanyl-D-alanine carboxypeptidase/D-alanyl-D-alanine-endopeptidase (penicillin-binding protein 4)
MTERLARAKRGRAALRALALASLLLPTLPHSALVAQSLSSRVQRTLDAPPYDRHLWGLAVVDERGKLVAGRNADRMFIPASNTKLVVAAVAAALLGPDFTVRTSVYPAGPVQDGVVQGDLVLYGRGDPTFSRRCYAVDTTAAGACDADPMARLRALADTLKRRGIRTVAGDVVGDGSYFDDQIVHPGWETYDVNWWYAAPVSGLGFNDNSLDISYAPAPTLGAPALLAVAPDFGEVRLENRTQTVAPALEETLDFFRVPATDDLYATGAVAQDSKASTQYFAVRDPSLFTARAFRRALEEAGIAVLGGTISTLDSTLYAPARRGPALAETTSRPARDWIFPVLNTSQNWFAEMLLKQLGRHVKGEGSWRAGLEVERRFLIDSMGIDSTQFALSDGSGLASTNLVSPLAFTQLLRWMRTHPNYEAFAAALPLSGQRGSLRTRFTSTPLSGRVRAKTGSIGRVNTLSGYVEQGNGRVLTFSVQANHHTLPGRQMIAQIDSVVVELAR